MKKTVILSATVVVFALGGCGNSTDSKGSTEAFDTTKLKTGEVYYQCEMHADVISDKEGKCPKCGMELMKIEKGQLK